MRVPDWSTLHDAYGSADRIPDLLARAREEDGAWPELWSRLCHQGTVYAASFAALPELARLAADSDDALFLAGAIVASDDIVGTRQLDRAEHSRALDELAARARAALASATDDTGFVYVLQSLVAFESGGVWARELETIAEGEVELTCPACDADLLLTLGDQPTLTSYDDEGASPVSPGEPVDDVERDLLDAADDHGRVVGAAGLRALFGRASCPACGEERRIAAGL